MLALTLALFVGWQIAILLIQFSEPLRKRFGALNFYGCGLLPTWRMFGPRPLDGDYLIYYRTAKAKAEEFTEWQPLNHNKKPIIPAILFFHPKASLTKILHEISQEAAKARSEQNVYYQLLLNELIRRLKKERAHHLVQFQICWKSPASLTPIFSSHVHPY